MELRADVIDGVRIAAVIDKNNILALYSRPDDDRLWVGDIVTAKILRYAPAQRAYFLDAHNREILLPHKSSTALNPGDSITVQIERPATRDKHPRAVLSEKTPQKGVDVLALAQRDFPELKVANKDLEDFDVAIAALRTPIVPLKNGINIVINEITALTAIDVNTAAPDLSPFEVNKIAATAIFQHLSLRNLQGQIVIDFLRLRDPDQKKEFHDFVNGLAVSHHRPVTLYGFTRMGLFELTREKHGLSLNDVFSLTRK